MAKTTKKDAVETTIEDQEGLTVEELQQLLSEVPTLELQIKRAEALFRLMKTDDFQAAYGDEVLDEEIIRYHSHLALPHNYDDTVRHLTYLSYFKVDKARTLALGNRAAERLNAINETLAEHGIKE